MTKTTASTPDGKLRLCKIEVKPFNEIDFLAESSDNAHVIDMIENHYCESIIDVYDEYLDYDTNLLIESFLTVNQHLTTEFYIFTVNPIDLILLMYKKKIIGSYHETFRHNNRLRNDDFKVIEQILILSANLKVSLPCVTSAEEIFVRVYTIRETLKAVNIAIPETLRSHPAYSALNFIWNYDFNYRLNILPYINSDDNDSVSFPPAF